MEFNIQKIEKKILNFWNKENIFEKSISQRNKNKDFVFYEGPPTANGKPGIHHFLSRAFKDLVCRYKTMQGFKVQRKAGWDTHGLPVEIEIEKKLKINTKKEIEKFGIEKFNELCKKSVWEYKKEWEKFTQRIGFWIGLKNPYITYTKEYIETVWFILKKIYEKGFLYEGLKVNPYCPRCGTFLSSHEVAQGYKTVKETSIFVKFKILNPEFENTSLLIWTTTPWTLPGNVAVAFNTKFKYVKVKINDEYLILAKERIKDLGLENYSYEEIDINKFSLISYEPPYPVKEYQSNIYKLFPADFVTLEEGTGLVHIAPAFGPEDMELIENQNLKLKEKKLPEFPIILNVNEEGKFKLFVEKFAGIFVKDADPLIIKDLKERNFLFKEKIIEHEYPFCWRCKTPLIFFAKNGWFIKMSALKNDLISNNRKINWIPKHIKTGRFGEWLKEAKDWSLSRERYWGTPLPIWECKKCGYRKIIGSINELKEQKFSQNRYLFLRHGESEMNLRNIIISSKPEKILSSLTERGKKEIKRVAKKLKKENIDIIISSDLERTRETAEILGKELNIEPIFDKRLRDIKAGIFEGKLISEFEGYWSSYKERFFKKPKGGENYNDVRKRIFNFIKEIDKKYTGKTILIISHSKPILMFQGTVLGYDIKDFEEKIERNKIKTGEYREIEFKDLPYNKKWEIDLHKPYVDNIKFYCPKCGEKMERVSFVIDCWFDSGAMPFAQEHWPFSSFQNKINEKQKLKPPKLFPADFISEGIDQTRGWFYTLLSISTLLGFGPSYKNVISLGIVLDEKGEKMSKSKGNVVSPWYIIEKYGVDATRWYFYTINQPGDYKLFSEKDIEKTKNRFILTFWNCFVFLKTYIRKIKTINPNNIQKLVKKSNNILDKWIISKFYSTILISQNALEKYEINKAAREIENFIINDLSLWYIRRSRKIFQNQKQDEESQMTVQVLTFVLFSLAKITAPFLPFQSEFFYQELKHNINKSKISVHLEDFPKVNKELIDKNLEKEMEKIREICSLALAERAKHSIKVRQPLGVLKIKPDFFKIKNTKLLDLIKEEVNVKEIVFEKTLKEKIELDTTLTEELIEEGIKREFIRNIQSKRKEMNLKPKDKILVEYGGDSKIISIISKNEENIKKEAKIEVLREVIIKDKNLFKEISFDEKKVYFTVKKFDFF